MLVRRDCRRLGETRQPTLKDELYHFDHDSDSEEFESVLTEFEPVFDAADFFRMGKDIVGQLSHVTNEMGVEWLKRHLGKNYRVHLFEFDDPAPMHIDTTVLPLAPGKVMVNRSWSSKIPSIFKDWEVLFPPKSVMSDSHPLFFTSRWISINTLMLDDRNVLVEAGEKPLHDAFRSWGFEPIPVPFQKFQTFGGSFHCATLDVRRRGVLSSYVG